VSHYLRNVIYRGQFDGDTVEVVLLPLRFKDALRFRGLEGDAVTALLLELLPVYVQEVRGLVAADGTVIGKDELLGSSYFAPLLVLIGLELVQHATPSNPPPPAS
jgi:hypothetical protein